MCSRCVEKKLSVEWRLERIRANKPILKSALGYVFFLLIFTEFGSARAIFFIVRLEVSLIVATLSKPYWNFVETISTFWRSANNVFFFVVVPFILASNFNIRRNGRQFHFYIGDWLNKAKIAFRHQHKKNVGIKLCHKWFSTLSK